MLRPQSLARPAFFVAITAALVFGAADQYLGSRVALGEWASSASNMSAPWLIVAFLAGMTARSRRGAAATGLAATLAALAGYFALTVSPLEGVPTGSLLSALRHLLEADRVTIAAAFATGPLFGVLGWRWQGQRSFSSLVAVSGALLLEPLARALSNRLPEPTCLWLAEPALGAACALLLLRHRTRSSAPIDAHQPRWGDPT